MRCGRGIAFSAGLDVRHHIGGCFDARGDNAVDHCIGAKVSGQDFEHLFLMVGCPFSERFGKGFQNGSEGG